jgi:hypothetical protein
VHALRSALAAVLLVAHAGCVPRAPGESGVLDLRVSTGALAASTVQVTITPGEGPPFDPITASASFGGSAWTLSVSAVPAGARRGLEVVARDGAGVVTAAGSAQVDVAAGERLAVLVLLQAPVPPPIVNEAPVIDFVSALPGGVPAGGAVQLAATAHDPNPDDAVAYRWTATCGAFDDPARAASTWTAPAAAGDCTVTITVSDTSGLSVSTSLPLAVY